MQLPFSKRCIPDPLAKQISPRYPMTLPTASAMNIRVVEVCGEERRVGETALEYSAEEEDRLVVHLATSEMRSEPFIRVTYTARTGEARLRFGVSFFPSTITPVAVFPYKKERNPQ